MLAVFPTSCFDGLQEDLQADQSVLFQETAKTAVITLAESMLIWRQRTTAHVSNMIPSTTDETKLS